MSGIYQCIKNFIYLVKAAAGNARGCSAVHICDADLFRFIILKIDNSPVWETTCKRGIGGRVSFSPKILWKKKIKKIKSRLTNLMLSLIKKYM